MALSDLQALMKDRKQSRAVDVFYDVLRDLKEGGETSWCDAMLGTNSSTERLAHVRVWRSELERALPPRSVKYGKAVAAITGAPALVYHALKYKDVSALRATGLFKGLDALQNFSNLPQGDQALLWEYLDEMAEHAFLVDRKPLPRVPTPEDIAKNIADRRGSKNENPVLGQGACELLEGLLKRHEVRAPEKGVEAILTLITSDGVTGDNLTTPSMRRIVSAHLGVDEARMTSVDWDDVTRALAMNTMDRAIPNDMMRGIEAVAQQLSQDIASGKKTLNGLDVEEIGQSVLRNVSSGDVSAFAANIDKIVPALGSLKMGTPHL